MSRVRALLVAVLLAALTACGGQSGPVAEIHGPEDDDGYHGTYIPKGYVVPPVQLEDTEGEPFNLARDDADLNIVFYGYTNCPDICQVVMGTIASAYVRLSDADKERVNVVFVTTDPARDDAQAMRAYLDRFDPAFMGVTGKLADIDRMGKSMGIFIKKGKKLPSGGYEVDHTTSVTAVTDGVAPLVWTYGIAPKQLSDDIEKLLDEVQESA